MPSEDEQHRVAIQAREKQVLQLLSRPSAALKAALTDPPYSAKSPDVRVRGGGGEEFRVLKKSRQKSSMKVVVKAIQGVAEKEIAGVIDELSGEEQDVLMKYLYRGLEEVEACNSLLKWHAILTEKAGVGCIMRVLADRNKL